MFDLILEIRRDDGAVLVADGRRWAVPVDGGLEGFGGVSYDVPVREYSQYDGGRYSAERTPAQERSVTMHGRFDPAEARDEAMGFFIPHREYTVRCTHLGRTRHFTGRQLALEVETGSPYARTVVKWTCLCAQPFWLSEEAHSYDIAEADGRRGFPFASPTERWAPSPVMDMAMHQAAKGHVAGFVVGTISNATRLVNRGHVPTYPRIDVTCSKGTVVDPTVRVLDASGGTAMSVTVKTTMADGDALVLDFTERPTRIELNGRNISHLAVPGSTLAASIGVGAYTVEWSAKSGDAAMRVVPSIEERYTGI